MGTSFKRSGAGISAGNSSRVSGKRLYTDSGKRAVLPRAARRAPPRKERGALAVNEGALGKGDEPGAIHGVPVEGEDRSRMSANTFERAGYNGVSGGTVLATKSVGDIGSAGQLL